MLEMKAVTLALAAFLPQLSGQSVILMSDNASVVAYLLHQGSTVSRAMCLMASEITMWTKWHSVRLSTRYIPGTRFLGWCDRWGVDPCKATIPQVAEFFSSFAKNSVWLYLR